ncbi:hypothetical protein NX059_001844 [Plenodomus lindquistii]|nr:hypothetical protein NX059_011132 [Plenodomus lindquistii]KAI8943873.1 hypothetical protein NX059_001844 [Plenodomus lindquistii]
MSASPHTPQRGQQNRARAGPSPRQDDMEVDSSTIPVETQSSVNSELHNRRMALGLEVVSAFLKKIVNSRSVAQLVSSVPAVAQDRTRVNLDNIVQAHVKKALAVSLLAEWRDCIAKENFDSILELKSLRAPSIQVSKLAEHGGSIPRNFDESLKEAKKLSLTRMIEIKDLEVQSLTGLGNQTQQANLLHRSWLPIAQMEGVSFEASAILLDPACSLSLVQSAISIGENTAQKQMSLRAKKSSTVKRARRDGTAVMPTDSKSLEVFVKEIAKRQRQSAQDKAKANKKKSGKGRRGAGPSKTKNQKNPNKIGKKNRQQKNGKRGSSSRRQPKKP